MNAFKDQKGMATVLVLLFIVALVPLLALVLRRHSQQLVYANNEKHIKSARLLASSSVSDLMSQFTADYSMDHYDSFFLEHTGRDFLRSGYADVALTPSAADRAVS